MLTREQNRKVIEELARKDATVKAHLDLVRYQGYDHEAMLTSLVVALVKDRKELLRIAVDLKKREGFEEEFTQIANL